MHPGPAKWRNGQLNYRSSRSSFRKVIMQCYDITLFMDHSPKRYVIQPLVTLNTMGGKPVQRGSNLVQGWVQFVIAKLPSHANGNRWLSHPFLFLQKMFDLHFSNAFNKNPILQHLAGRFSLKPEGSNRIRPCGSFGLSMWGTWPLILKGIAQAMLLKLGHAWCNQWDNVWINAVIFLRHCRSDRG